MRRASDADFMRRAVELALKGAGHTRPNPAVGAVIVRNGRIVGEGWHKRAGGDHAEVAAIKDALKHSNSQTLKLSNFQTLKGATLYVTLEPCSRPGRVGACTDAIVAAGIARVVYGAVDPNPKNRGRAKRILARHGIACERFISPSAPLPAPASQLPSPSSLILPFSKHVLTGLPYVTVKIAMSLDGKICDDFGEAKWVSSAAARKTTGKLRERVDAIMVGAETVRRDDPSLLSHGKRNDDLVRVVVSRSGKLPKTAQVFADGRNPTLVFDDGVKALRALGKMGMMHVLCEGGLKLATSLAEAGMVDEWITVLAPKVIGRRRIAKAVPVGNVSCLQDW